MLWYIPLSISQQISKVRAPDFDDPRKRGEKDKANGTAEQRPRRCPNMPDDRINSGEVIEQARGNESSIKFTAKD